jgi:hypothetical protein
MFPEKEIYFMSLWKKLFGKNPRTEEAEDSPSPLEKRLGESKVDIYRDQSWDPQYQEERRAHARKIQQDKKE